VYEIFCDTCRFPDGAWSKPRLLVIAALAAFCLFGSPDILAAKRVALVIGNNSYVSIPPLHKAVNDARAVGSALTDLGFSVVVAENLARRDMNRSVSDLEAKVEPGDEVFFFYAGHGVAIDGENYLIPTDMPKPGEGEESLVVDEAMSVATVIRRIEGRGAGVAFMVLDACRDNPFAGSGTRGIGGTRGLARVDAPTGVFVLFSAGIGQTALDRLSDTDTDPNSVFTRKLVPLLRTPGISHVSLAKRVQVEVIDLAATINHKQEPAYYDQIKGEIFLHSGAGASSAGSVPPAVPSLLSEAAQAWKSIELSEDPRILEAFRKQYGSANPLYDALAAGRLEQLAKKQLPAGQTTIAALPAESLPHGAASAPETGDAREYTVASLGADADPRLVKAVGALASQELRFGYLKGHLYIAVLNSGINWDDSKELAERAGGHLVTITNREENDFVSDLFAKDERFIWIEGGGQVHGPWIGLMQADGAREPKGGWRWVTGEPMKFAGWNPGNPDNFMDSNFTTGQNRGTFFSTRNKLAMLGRVNRWDDCAGEAEQHGFVMELD
jgi:hypothetical protein